ncbi:hemolymph juvenile hormone binding protein (JHBP) [Popillia japonica]|uniref:Hemolymph juvenile hormone binding protein (JHBP) n=1 Tax=Popillia japonica TaxID=7064 RepID=A0AAW1NAV8_POPJA
MNLSIKGLEKAKILTAKVDLENKKLSTEIYFDKLDFTGTYLVNGRILILPIQGHGRAEISFGDIIIRFYTEYELLNNNGTDYMNLTNSKVSYTVKRAAYNLKDLFNGDEFLGEQTNKFLNENWKDLHQEFSPAIAGSIKTVVLKILTRILDVVPFNEIFLP